MRKNSICKHVPLFIPERESVSRSVTSDSLWPYGLQLDRLFTVRGILQARILEWADISFFRRSSQPRDQTQVSHTAGDSLPAEPQGKPKNIGVSSHSLLQGIFPTHGSNPGLPHCRQILYQLGHQGRPRILEWVFSSGSSRPRNWTGVSCIAGGFFTSWATREAPDFDLEPCISHITIPFASTETFKRI